MNTPELSKIYQGSIKKGKNGGHVVKFQTEGLKSAAIVLKVNEKARASPKGKVSSLDEMFKSKPTLGLSSPMVPEDRTPLRLRRNILPISSDSAPCQGDSEESESLTKPVKKDNEPLTKPVKKDDNSAQKIKVTPIKAAEAPKPKASDKKPNPVSAPSTSAVENSKPVPPPRTNFVSENKTREPPAPEPQKRPAIIAEKPRSNEPAGSERRMATLTTAAVGEVNNIKKLSNSIEKMCTEFGITLLSNSTSTVSS